MAIVVQLDREREVRWGARAQTRNASLQRPVSFRDLNNAKRRSYVLCAIIWAALVEKDHEFADPEDLSEYLKTGDQQAEALKAIGAMIDEAFPPQKKSDGAKR